ncbi:protein spaetzle 5-like [Culicoides brevitarsis]|uniref:protein spaetzle 5-like n=1 Tax=Culicoides brevitarsis TaxID=469753 RepID=UPI00307C518A
MMVETEIHPVHYYPDLAVIETEPHIIVEPTKLVTIHPTPLDALTSIDHLIVHQKADKLEAISGYETQNKYAIFHPSGQQLFFAAEDSDWCMRMCYGKGRPFEMSIIDVQHHQEVIHISRPFRCGLFCFNECKHEIEIFSQGVAIGSVRQNFSWFYPNFSVKNEVGETVLKITGPCIQASCGGDVDFSIMTREGYEIGKISKKWSGFAREMFTDADNFGINFPMDLDGKMKAVLIGALFLIDFMCKIMIWCYFVLNLVLFVTASPPCGLYGQPPCKFLPAMPGSTPSCASPGSTYCEKIKDYPVQVIKSLLQTVDFQGMIVDETFDEFYSYTNVHKPEHHSYGPPMYNYVPPPTTTKRPEGYTYGPRTHYGDAGSYNHGRNLNFIFGPTQSQGRYYNQNSNNINHNRYYRSIRHHRSPKNITNDDFYHSNFTKSRSKRQLAFGREQLCQVRTQFVNPQAALSTQGDWKYVINQGQQATQLVKTEVCASSICSNLCQLPNGYSSRCEQKFVQKRLVALETTGQRLYTDTFWFPSCCVCTLSNDINN